MTTVNLTAGRIVILNVLKDNLTHKWSELRKKYFGPDRAAQQASTAFYTQLNKTMIKKLSLVEKSGEGYKITNDGLTAINEVIAAKGQAYVDSCKSEAQVKFELANPTTAKTAAAIAEEVPAETEVV